MLNDVGGRDSSSLPSSNWRTAWRAFWTGVPAFRAGRKTPAASIFPGNAPFGQL